MAEAEFPSNASSAPRPRGPQTEKQPQQKQRAQRVTRSEAIQRKKSFFTRLKETFVGDSSKGVLDYVVTDVIVPSAKDMIADAVIGATERKLFGIDRGHSRRGYSRSSSALGLQQYNRMGPPSNQAPSSRREDPRALSRGRSRPAFDQNEWLVASRPEANEVVEQMFTILSQYGTVSQRDFFDLIGAEANHTDEKWGWTDLRGTTVHRAGDGYLIDLPRPEPID